MNFKPYPEYKDSGVEWIGEIPKDWKVKKLKQIVETKITDGPHETPELLDYGIPFISAEAIKNDKIDFSLKRGFISEHAHKLYCNKCKPKRDDIFLIKSGATTGNVAIVDTDEEFSIWSPLALIRTNSTQLIPYLAYYILLSDYFKKMIEISWSYGTQQNIGMGVIENITIVIPDIQDQRKIVRFLDKKTTEIDSTIEKDTRLIELLKEKRTALINHLVTKGLDPTVNMKDSGVEWIGEIPEDWKIKKLKLISTIVLGKMLTPLDKGGYYLKPYLRAQNISWEHVNTDKIKEMWFSKNELNIYRLHKDDLLVSEGGEVGRTAIWKEEISECYIQNSVHKVTLNPENNPKYFLYAFESCGKSNFFLSIVNRVSIAHLTREKLKEITFPVPNKLEQDRITDYLDVKTSMIDQTIQKIQENIDLLEEYKKSLIHHVVTGKINVIKED